MSAHKRMVVSIDWDYFTGDTRGYNDPCCLCRWKCDGKKSDNRHKRCINDKELEDSMDTGRVKAQEVFYKLAINHDIVFNFPACLKLGVDPMIKKLKGAEVIVADCHGSIYRHLEDGDTVINFDAHEDRGGTYEQPNCANWASKAEKKKGVKYIWNYSNWSPRFPKKRVDMVFLCLSSPYTPPKLDEYFYQLVKKISIHTGNAPKFVGLGARELEKKYRRMK